MIENYVQTNNRDVLKIGLKDENGNPILDKKGEIVRWTFDLADIELSLRYNQIVIKDKQLRQALKTKLLAIDKKQDVKGQGFMTRNEEEKMKAVLEFYEEEIKVIDSFLGQGGTRKFLNGRKPYIEMFEDIATALKPILTLFEKSFNSINDRIKNKYKPTEEEEVLE